MIPVNLTLTLRVYGRYGSEENLKEYSLARNTFKEQLDDLITRSTGAISHIKVSCTLSLLRSTS